MRGKEGAITLRVEELSRGFDEKWKARAFLAAIGTLGFFFPFSLFFVAGGFLPSHFGWMSSAIIILTGAATLLSELRLVNVRVALARFFLVAGLLFVIEYVGVNSGFPFGSYAYTGELGLLLAGVPVAISIAWYSTIINAWRIAEHLTAGMKHRGPIVTALVAGFLALGLDIALEPMAGFIQNYWLWALNRVPIQNYASWFVLSVVAVYLLARTKKTEERENGGITFRIALYLIGFHFTLFLVTILVNGYFMAAAIALALGMSPFALLVRRLRILRADVVRR